MKILLINLLCSVLLMQACNKNTKKQTKMHDGETFSYSTTFSAMKDYPAEAHIGYFTDERKNLIAGIPKAGVEADSWQYDGSKAGQGGNAVPSHLNLIYVAYAEKKFYQVDADVPKAKILELFRKGFMIKGKKGEDGKTNWQPSTYETITVGAAPGGVIVVWLSGNHHRTEVCRLQAKEIALDKNEFLPHAVPDETQQQFFDSSYDFYIKDDIKTQIKNKGIPLGLWDEYRTKYKYRFVVDSYDDTDFFKQIFRINYNGESEYLINKEAVAQYKDDAIPYSVIFSFKQNNADVFFDDTEMLKVFADLKKEFPNEPIDIVVQPEFRYKNFKFFVQCKDKKIELKKVELKKAWGLG